MRNVVVTGGSRGLGLGIVRRLVEAGYRAIAVARKETPQLTAAMEHAERERPGSLAFVPFDLAEIDDLARLVKRLRTDYGPIWGPSCAPRRSSSSCGSTRSRRWS